jgi:hypothetical protein
MKIGDVLSAGVAGLLAAAPNLSAWQGTQAVIRNRDGSAACLIAQAEPARDQMTVHVRGPANPDAVLVPRLPADRRDFSALPVRVVLLAPTTDGTPRERRPLKVEALIDYPVINGQPSTAPFVRVAFPRAWLVAGTTILGVRTVALSAKDRVTSQTTCRISAADADQWR